MLYSIYHRQCECFYGIAIPHYFSLELHIYVENKKLYINRYIKHKKKR